MNRIELLFCIPIIIIIIIFILSFIFIVIIILGRIWIYIHRICALEVNKLILLITSAPQICSFQDGGVFIKQSFKALWCFFGLLNFLSKGYLNAWRFQFSKQFTKYGKLLL